MATLVTVNGKRIEVQEALRQVIMYSEEHLLERAVQLLLIEQYCKDQNIINTDEELQLAADELRYQNELEDVDKLNQWIQSRHLTLMSLQRGIDGHLLKNKIIASIPDEAIESFFAEHRLAFDWVELYSIRLGSQEVAQELHAQITEEGANFHVLAMEHSLDEDTRKLGGYVGKLKRTQVSGEIEASVFQGKAGDVVGPIKTEKGYNLFKVAAVGDIRLEEEADGIRHLLFDNLLAKLRTEATIEYPIFDRSKRDE